jgi:phosphatidate cytidylyltransferase
MSDENWRRRRDDDDFSEYGSLFDDADATQNLSEVSSQQPERDPVERDPGDAAPLNFGESDTGSLPHWTEPPTGELPALDTSDVPADDEELDVWSSFSSEAPVWKDDQPDEIDADPLGDTSGVTMRGADERASGRHDVVSGRHDRVSGRHDRVSGRHDRVSGQTGRVTGESSAIDGEPSRITIGTDPSGMARRPAQAGRRRTGQQAVTSSHRAASLPSGRDMPAAVGVGLLLAAVFVGTLMWRPMGVAAFVTIILGLAAVEFYDKVAEKGYRPAVIPGIVACVAAPLATYWRGTDAVPLAIVFGFMAIAGSFVGARSVEAGPMPNISITTLGMVWIGLMGSFAMLILRFSTNSGSLLEVAESRGTDTLFLLALGVVANDVGALFVGSAVGRTPLRQWISPNKTVEGLIGGTLFTLIAMMLVGITGRSTTWTSYADLLALAAVISVLAPMGDLVESMFKRNLDVKDFGSLVKGHGGILDRFDGVLFTLPGVYYLTAVLAPWAS